MKSVYIHIPFCSNICTYCDFSKMFYNEKYVDKYLEALEKEIKEKYKNEEIKTLYIGGGTPSSLNINQLEKLLNITNIFKKHKLEEFTIECNPENLDEDKIKLFKKYNVSRISLGVQTFNPKFLKYLNRMHDKEMVFNCINLLKKYDLTNINIDLIYALEGETKNDLLEDIKIYKELEIPHISTYSLIIEPNTILYNKNTQNINEELDLEMYNLIIDNLKDYNHYETSNFAKKGYESKHNLVYWNNLEYYGFGMGASGYLDNVRYGNTRSFNKYINGEYIKEENKLSKNEIIENEFILGFRKLKGINLKDFSLKYGFDILEIKQIKNLIEEGKLINDGENIYISREYIYLSNDILIEFLGVNYELYYI